MTAAPLPRSSRAQSRGVLELVPITPPATKDTGPGDLKSQCVEGLVRACVQRRAQLRRDLAAEDQRLNWLRRRLADQRQLRFIRVEAVEREFGGMGTAACPGDRRGDHR